MRAAALVLAAGAALLAEAGIGAQAGRPSGHMVSYAGAPTLGDPQAPLVLIEFSDFHCPYCRQHAKQTLPQIRKDYVATGKLLYVFRQYPAARPGPLDAAVAAQCAARQDRFWELHDRLFSAPRPVAPGDLERHARAAGVDAGIFRTCFKAGVARSEVELQIEDARRLGLGGTPGFVVGFNEVPRVRVVQRIGGAQPFESFKGVFDALLGRRLRSGTSLSPQP